MSACDTCCSPGRCCKDFPLIGGGPLNQAETLLEAMVVMASMTYESPDQSRILLGFPFIPHEKADTGTFYFHCVNLTEDGRCGDYENRPYGPCVVYYPSQDKMCVQHANWEGLGPWAVGPFFPPRHQKKEVDNGE